MHFLQQLSENVLSIYYTNNQILFIGKQGVTTGKEVQ